MYIKELSIQYTNTTLDHREDTLKKGEKFLKGPISMGWLAKAGNLPGKSLHTAIVIWHLWGISKGKPVPISTKLLNNFGVDRFSKSRSIENLEKAGLISVTRKRGRNPIVTVNHLQDNDI